MLTKRNFIVTSVLLFLCVGFLQSVEPATSQKDRHHEQVFATVSMKSEASPDSDDLGKKDLTDTGREIDSVTPVEQDVAKHESGIPHECLESIRLGANGKLPDVELSDSELMHLKEQEKIFAEEMSEEFEHFIVSDDGASILDKRAITEDFQALVDASNELEDGDVEAVAFDE